MAGQVRVVQNLPEKQFRFFKDRNSGLEIFGLGDFGNPRLEVDRLFEEDEVALVAEDLGRPDDVIAREDDAAGVLQQHRRHLNCKGLKMVLESIRGRQAKRQAAPTTEQPINVSNVM